MGRRLNWETATRAVLGHDEPEGRKGRKKPAITLPRLKCLEDPMPPDVPLPKSPGRGGGQSR